MIRFIAQPSGPVFIREFTPETTILFIVADRWSRGAGVAIDVNAIDNGAHGPGTLHGQSRAWDLDTQGDKPEHLVDLWRYLRALLPPGFDVVREKDHVHVEWQPKR